jgi:hypothetical protein
MTKKKQEYLYYIVATNKLTRERERISGYISSASMAQMIRLRHVCIAPDKRAYLRPVVKKCKAAEVLKH